jgi:hypothetical protein
MKGMELRAILCVGELPLADSARGKREFLRGSGGCNEVTKSGREDGELRAASAREDRVGLTTIMLECSTIVTICQ